MPGLVIERRECSYLGAAGERWLLLYGRRKTGKTWLLRRCSGWTLYATVASDGHCILETRGKGRETLPAPSCVERIATALRRRGVVVVDEFQRLPRSLWDHVAAASWEAEAGLRLCGSSMRLAAKVFSRNSPLLGLAAPLRVDIAAYSDTLASLRRAGLPPRDAALWAVVARDPWLLRHTAPGRSEPWRVLSAEAPRLLPAARGLVGEVFEEEERQLTRLYDAVLRLLAEGYWRAADIAQRLHQAGLAPSPEAGYATGVLAVLEEIGLVERVPLWRTRRSRRYYRHRSSLLALLYSVADEVEELGLTPSPDALRSRYGVELGFNIGEMMAERHGLARGYSIQPGGRDVDAVLLDRHGSPQWGYEVKAGPMSAGELRGLAEWLRSLGIPRAGAVALGGLPPAASRLLDDALDAEGLAELAARLAEEAAERARREAASPD